MIKLIKSTFFNEKETKKALCQFIKKSDQFSIGKECKDFEDSFSKWQGRKYSVMFNSGSSANLALVQALINLGLLKRDDKVGFSSLTWSTNVMPLITFGLKPIPIDIEINTLNVSSINIVATYKKNKFKCLFITNLLGFCDDIDEIKKFCNKKNILIIEDNCESLGSKWKSKKLGNFGLASTFSFYVGHHLSTVEGGMICTDNRKLDTMLRMVRSHGWDRHLSQKEQKILRKRHKIEDFYGKYTFYDVGYNFRPTEIQGFLGKEQMKYIDIIIDRREKNFKKFEIIYNNQDFLKTKTNNLTKISNFAFPLVCKDRKTKEKYLNLAKKAQIEIRPIVAGSIANQIFFKKYITARYHLPNAEFVHSSGFYFGNNPDLTQKEINLIINTFS